ncbi:MAG TPA: chemotaxis-specific protein-glutamate methyltransferase CheB [Stellaceae bacterium]|nr:chemotaxis-specific protein-glutamate methyltransferase CheB [Stellaceae bacterium]
MTAIPLPPSTHAALRVLVVDDVGFMRIALRQIIETDGDMLVVGEARNGEEALALARDLKPDIVTMDVEMPVMDGIEATRRILAEVAPKPIVIMVSSYTQAGAAATVKALRNGAADFVSKESAFSKTDLGHIDAKLREKIRVLAKQRIWAGDDGFPGWTAGAAAERDNQRGRERDQERDQEKIARERRQPSGPVDLIAIGASTGGPEALGVLLGALGPIAPPIVIAQHMPEFFTACLAESLSRDTGLTVREGEHRKAVPPGEVTILPGGRDAIVAPQLGGGFELRLTQSASVVHPSADLLFESVAMAARNPVAVILTGMGDDGTRGAGRFARRGLPVLVQRPDSCVIGGMPGAAIEAGVASGSFSLIDLARNLRHWASAGFHPRKAEMAKP